MHKTVIEAEKGNWDISLKELLNYKDLFLILAYRDFKVKYAQTFLGFIWAFLQPAATLLIFTLVFGRAVKVDTGSIPYPVFALTGLVAWTYFSFVMAQAGDSIIGAQQMVKKIYFPRLIIPLAKSIVGFVDFAIAFLFLMVLLVIFRVTPSHNLIFLPVFILQVVVASLGIGIWLSALNIRYRDFKHLVPFLIQLGLYVSPVGYPSDLVPEKYQLIYHLNPVVGIIEGFRFSILGESLNQYSILSALISLIIFLSSIFYFKKVEKVMADLV
jgi:lipopolysaccharide transport system permease protein